MTAIRTVTLEVTDLPAAQQFYRALGLEDRIGLRPGDAPTSGVLRAPDGTLWKVVSESKKDTGAVSGEITDIVVLLGVDDVRDSKRAYLEQGFEADKSFGGKYVEFRSGASPLTLGLLERRALAEDAGVDAEGTGSHRIVLGSDGPAFTDPDGFAWEPVA